MPAAISEYQLQKQADRRLRYLDGGGMWWSPQLHRWMVADKGLVSKILKNDAFAGHGYGVSVLMERFGIDLRHIEQMTRHLPLAHEGEEHRSLRRAFSAEIAANSERAMHVFERTLQARISELLVPGGRFCAMQQMLAPASLASVFALAGIDMAPPPGAATIPLLFDDTITIKKRLEINAILDAMFHAMPGGMPGAERYFRLAMIALSANTLLGSLGESLALTLEKNAGITLREIEWDRDFPATGLPLIEKRVVRDVLIGGFQLQAGQRVRLFLDAAGFRNGEGPVFNEIYFATGPHKCPGMGFSRKSWKLLVSQLRESPCSMRLHSATHRKHDNVFNFAESLEVSVHA